MNAVLLIVLIDMKYPAMPLTVDRVGIVGFILTLKGQVFSLILYNESVPLTTEKRARSLQVGLEQSFDPAVEPSGEFERELE